MTTSRRRFLRQSTTLLAGTGMLPAVWKGPFRPSPSDQINIGLIGARSMGYGDLANAIKQPGVKCIGLCDVDSEVLNQRAEDVQKQQGSKPALYKDFRQMLDNKDLDAVIIGTPDHWHCLPFVYACQAGKDIYVEKPLANSIAECRLMSRAARKYNRVVQVGQQQRSGLHWQTALDRIRHGGIGPLRKVQVWGNFNYGIGQPVVPDEAPPPSVDFDFWLGPAPKRSFNRSRFHGSWRMFWDYGGGLITDWGVHLLDMALWPKDVDYLPLSVSAAGGNLAYADHAHETFDTMSVTYQMKDYIITWEHTAGTQNGPWNKLYGLAFVGNDATIVINREGWELIPEKDAGKEKVPAISWQPGNDYHEAHMKNFLDCIRTRNNPACSIENGARVAQMAHMGNLALKTGCRLVWDESRGDFGNGSPANALIKPAYRAPWSWPEI